jgi:hypothetical protein
MPMIGVTAKKTDMQNDTNPSPPSGTSPTTPKPRVPTGGQRVIQPRPGLAEEMQAQGRQQQSVSQPVAPPTPIQSIYDQPTNPMGSQGQMQVGMSASQLKLDTPTHKGFAWGRLVKEITVLLVVVVAFGGGFLYLKNLLSSMQTKTLSNGGYTYSFKLNKSATEVQLSNGSSAYKYANTLVASVEPSNSANLASCSQIGSQWQEAFSVKVYGAEQPVCTPNGSAYMLYFTALNHNHLFSVTYGSPQTSSVYPTLKAIFSSVSVSQ